MNKTKTFARELGFRARDLLRPRADRYCSVMLCVASLVGCDAGQQSASSTSPAAGAAGMTGALGRASGRLDAGVSVSGNAGASSGADASTLGGASNNGSAGASTVNGGASGQTNTAGNGGAVATAGAAGSTATGSAGNTDGAFSLAWQDDFNTLDTSAWQLENFTYDGNQAQFTPQNAQVTNGTLTLSLTAAGAGAAKPYLGVEMRSVKTLTYGKVSARMRFAKGSGVVSGLVLFYTPYPNCDWNEIDIEHLGDVPTSSQLNAMVFTGVQNPACTASVTPTQDPLVAPLGFDAESDYHSYDIEWTPAGVKYLADGVVLRTWTQNIALLQRPQNILLTIWASNAASWAGALTATSAPTSADIDWIKVYSWNG